MRSMRHMLPLPLLLPLLASASALEGSSAIDVHVSVDWAQFLHRHDLKWDWIWGSTKASTLSPRNEDLHRCGPAGAPGQCCLEAAAPKLGDAFPGFIQLALARQAPWGCAPSASPPNLCCLPVPGESLISGCHPSSETRWNFNQFFSVTPANNGSAFKMKDKATKSCYTLATGAKSPSIAACSSSDQQLWKILNPSGQYLVQNVASGTCVTASAAKEASEVTMGECVPSATGDNSWQPLCDAGPSPLPDWPCFNISHHPSPSPPPRPPPPAPPPPVHGDPVFLAACDGSKLSQQWHITSAGQVNVGDGKRCLTNGGVVAPCNGTGQTWGPPAPIDGFFQLSSSAGRAAGHCLQVDTPQLFCGSPTSTVCPKAYLQNFTTVRLYRSSSRTLLQPVCQVGPQLLRCCMHCCTP